MSRETVLEEIKRSGDVFTRADILRDIQAAKTNTETVGLDLAGVQSMMPCTDELSEEARCAIEDCVAAQQVLARKIQLAHALLG